MFSQSDDTLEEEWFRRFDAASRRLPAEERASQRQEIQQHLERLVAANEVSGQTHDEAWKAALEQFGDPTQIGRKMYQEWQYGRTGFCADMKAILFGIGLQILRRSAVQLLYFFWFNRLYNSGDSLYTHGQGLIGLAFIVNMGITYGATILINAAIGRNYPSQAIKAAFYADILWSLWTWVLIAVTVFVQHNHILPWLAWFIHSMLLMPLWMVSHVTVAYLASVTKRGWYKPALSDFKLALPRKQRQLSR